MVHRRKQKPFCFDRLSTPIKACAAVFLGGPLLPDSANILSSSRTRTIITTRAIDHREARCNLAHLAVSNLHAGNLAQHLRVDGTERTERTARARLVDAKTSETSGHLTVRKSSASSRETGRHKLRFLLDGIRGEGRREKCRPVLRREACAASQPGDRAGQQGCQQDQPQFFCGRVSED